MPSDYDIAAAREAARRAKANSTSDWWTAVEKGEQTRMKQLLADGQDVNAQDATCEWPALYYAAWKNRLWQAELLLASGADVALQSREGDTAVHIAAMYGSLSMLTLMLSSKVVDSKNERGLTPLDLAKQASASSASLRLPSNPSIHRPPSPPPQKRKFECVGALQKAPPWSATPHHLTTRAPTATLPSVP